MAAKCKETVQSSKLRLKHALEEHSLQVPHASASPGQYTMHTAKSRSQLTGSSLAAEAGLSGYTSRCKYTPAPCSTDGTLLDERRDRLLWWSGSFCAEKLRDRFPSPTVQGATPPPLYALQLLKTIQPATSYGRANVCAAGQRKLQRRIHMERLFRDGGVGSAYTGKAAPHPAKKRARPALVGAFVLSLAAESAQRRHLSQPDQRWLTQADSARRLAGVGLGMAVGARTWR